MILEVFEECKLKTTCQVRNFEVLVGPVLALDLLVKAAEQALHGTVGDRWGFFRRVKKAETFPPPRWVEGKGRVRYVTERGKKAIWVEALDKESVVRVSSVGCYKRILARQHTGGFHDR